jgi:ribosomal protein S27E
MEAQLEIQCEQCRQPAAISQVSHMGPGGRQIQWPKIAVMPDGVYLTVTCLQCGERSQKIADRPELECGAKRRSSARFYPS